MPNYRRNYEPGGTFFFTLVTHQRRPLLATQLARDCLRQALEEQKEARPFEIVGIVILPDHFHTVWTLPKGDTEYSLRWALIKERFT